MKNVFYTGFLLLGVSLFAEADVNTIKPIVETKKIISATRGDIKVIEASENIRYLSQKLVKEYLFFYKYPEKTEVNVELEKILLKLNDDFRIIATTTKDSDTKDVLEFLAYSKDQIEEIFLEKPNSEKAALMLDYSETLLEGANSIALAHKYDFSKEEKMLMTTKKMDYLLERITKYYMALNMGFNNPTNQESMKEAMNEFEENIQKINLYKYPEEQVKAQINMNMSWEANKVFLTKSDTLFIPKLMFTSTEHLENMIAKIALYHSKNR